MIVDDVSDIRLSQPADKAIRKSPARTSCATIGQVIARVISGRSEGHPTCNRRGGGWRFQRRTIGRLPAVAIFLVCRQLADRTPHGIGDRRAVVTRRVAERSEGGPALPSMRARSARRSSRCRRSSTCFSRYPPFWYEYLPGTSVRLGVRRRSGAYSSPDCDELTLFVLALPKLGRSPAY